MQHITGEKSISHDVPTSSRPPQRTVDCRARQALCHDGKARLEAELPEKADSQEDKGKAPRDLELPETQ